MSPCIDAIGAAVAVHRDALARKVKDPGVALPPRPFGVYVAMGEAVQAELDAYNAELAERSPGDVDLAVTHEIVARRSRHYSALRAVIAEASTVG